MSKKNAESVKEIVGEGLKLSREKQWRVVMPFFYMSFIPLVALGVVLILISMNSYKRGMLNEIKDELKSAAIAMEGAYDAVGESDFVRLESGTIIKGTFVVSGNYTLVDKMKEDSDIYMSFFYGNDLIVSAMQDKDGKRLESMTAPWDVWATLKTDQKEVFTDDLVVDGEVYYGYFLPIRKQDGTVRAAILAAKRADDVRHTIRAAMMNMLIISVALASISVAVTLHFTLKMIRMVYHLLKEEETIEGLKNANRAKSDFLAQMSHEIRTPINAVLGMDEMILRECKDESIVEYAYNIRSSGQSLLSIINDILDFSKIESGKLEIVPVEYELSSVLCDSYNMILMRANEKNLTVNVENDVTVPRTIYGDEVRVRQVITNLLTNAVKYTKQGSITLSVNWEKTDEKTMLLKIDVKDTGIGIREEDIDKLFSSFQRMEEKRNRNIEGTGLGLAITKQLTELMGGTITVTSEYGVGSTFSIVVPQQIVNDQPIGSFAEAYAHPVTQQYEYKEEFTAPDALVLVVDDVMVNLNVMKGLLKYTKVKLDLVQSGRAALEYVKEKKYDVIFLDHMMPEMDGIETLGHMKEMEDNPNSDTPVIALTANAILGAKDEYLSKGFTDYLSKPIQSVDLENMLIRYLPAEKVKLTSEEDRKKASEVKSEPDTAEKPERVADFMSEPRTKAADSFMGASPDIMGGLTEEELKRQFEELNGFGMDEDTSCMQDDSAAREELEARIPFLDTGVGFSYCMDAENYREIINTYITEDRTDDLTHMYADKDWENYRIVVHSIKSNSLYIGACRLSEDAKAIEYALKDGDTAFAEVHHDGLMAEYGEILEKLKSAMGR